MKKFNYKIFFWIWRTLIIVGVFLFLSWLFWQNMISSGYLRVQKDFSRQFNASIFLPPQQDFISNLYPNDRVKPVQADERGRSYQEFFSEPVYFKIMLPRSFEKIKLKIYYQNSDQPLFQIGLMRIAEPSSDWAFQLQPIENQHLDQLSWYKITEDGITLWQKIKKFTTIQDFVNHLPPTDRLARFYYDLTPEAISNPKKVIVWNSKTPMKYVDYVISRYQAPKTDQDLKVAEATFFINPEFSNGRQVEFMLSAPDLSKNGQTIKIYNIVAELEREPLSRDAFWATIKNIFSRLWKKIK